MDRPRPMFSICVPAYNRASRLSELLNSILAQDFDNYEIVICEDKSRERHEIASIVAAYARNFPNTRLRYFENSENLGYDANVRNLVDKAVGRYCFFMGNDDVMCSNALATVAAALHRHPNIGLVLKSYGWFDNSPDIVDQEVRYFTEERLLKSGREAISVCFRRVGVISGVIIHRDGAQAAATSEFDGTLYYQMHITGTVLARLDALFLPTVLVLCRRGEVPDFGNSAQEKGIFTPGRYTAQARLAMVGGALRIAKTLARREGIQIFEEIIRDYANYFYPYIKDQLTLPFRDYLRLYLAFGKLGFSRYFMFHLYFVICYCLGEKRFDKLTRLFRRALRRSPHFGIR